MNSDQYARQRDQIRTYFDQEPTRFEWIGSAGSGGYGICSALKEFLPDGKERKLVIKRAIGGESAALLVEIERLKQIQGGKHIVQTKTISNNPLQRAVPLESVGAFSDMTLGSGDESSRSEGSGPLSAILSGRSASSGQSTMAYPKPLIIMEFIGNGVLSDFIDKAGKARDLDLMLCRSLPNRVLWRFFFCLVRACVGMAWPNQLNDPDGERLLEEPRHEVEPGDFTHTDLSIENVMLGNIIHTELEHTTTPILKIMINLILLETYPTSPDGSSRGYSRISGDDEYHYDTDASAILPDDEGKNPFPYLDDDLRDKICECMAVDEEDRPELAGLFDYVKDKVLSRGAEYWFERRHQYDTGAAYWRETEIHMEWLLQSLLFEPVPFPNPYAKDDSLMKA
ncbi:hypothetical protein DL764_004695 [Monosporascus ibericus]|uniref:Protein kinase domain-containing protein n=1 Tax=Monosporascus ibericus TaxID=155417 RepID=A0A4Q4TBS2_9PEZI|nr:hypothetical protein DL764_004695 [Monosporascus ibericus]